jgi:hypothetical protein
MKPEYFAANSLVWPLTVILLCLLILWRVGDELQPVFKGVVNQLATQSQKYALLWVTAAMYGALASMQALIDVAHQLEWYYLEAFARVVGPGIAAIVAYNRQPIEKSSSTPTNPPFPEQTK